MSTTSQTAAVARPASSFVPPSAEERAALTTECLLAILRGQPLPEAARPPIEPPSRAVQSMREGFERILLGGAPRLTW